MNILLTTGFGLDKRSYARSIKRAFPLAKVHAVDVADKGYLPDFMDSVHQVPGGYDENYISEVLNLVEKLDIDLIIPASDPECIAWDKYLREGGECSASVANCKTSTYLLRDIFDKPKMVKVFKEKARYIKVPETSPFSWDELDYRVRTQGKVVVIKPAVDYGSRGLILVDPNYDYSDFMRKDKSPMMSYVQAVLLLRGLEGVGYNLEEKFIIQEYWSGASLCSDLLVLNGKIAGVTPHIRTGYRWGRLDEGTYHNSEYVMQCIQESIDITGVTDGPYCIELNYCSEESDELGLVEINPRVSAVNSQMRLLGYDLVANTVRWGLGMQPYLMTTEDYQRCIGTKFFITEDELGLRIK